MSVLPPPPSLSPSPRYTCRTLFERHKLLFSFQMCAKILETSGKLNMDEYNFFLRGGVVSWIEGTSEWSRLGMVASLKKPPDPEGKAQGSSEGAAESCQEQGHGKVLRAMAVTCHAPPCSHYRWDLGAPLTCDPRVGMILQLFHCLSSHSFPSLQHGHLT